MWSFALDILWLSDAGIGSGEEGGGLRCQGISCMLVHPWTVWWVRLVSVAFLEYFWHGFNMFGGGERVYEFDFPLIILIQVILSPKLHRQCCFFEKCNTFSSLSNRDFYVHLALNPSKKKSTEMTCQVRVKPDKSGVDLNNVKMSMNPFCEVRMPWPVLWFEH